MAAAFETMSTKPREAGTRRRSSLSLAAAIRLFGRDHDARVHNLSCGGAMIECDSKARVGDAIDLICGSIETMGEVVWVRPGRFGLAFLIPLEENEILFELQRLDAQALSRNRRDARRNSWNGARRTK